jgi:hypothetical protein
MADAAFSIVLLQIAPAACRPSLLAVVLVEPSSDGSSARSFSDESPSSAGLSPSSISRDARGGLVERSDQPVDLGESQYDVGNI